MGFEYELLKRFTDSHGLELQIIINKNLEEAFSRLNLGEVDVLAYDLSITRDRKEKIAFTRPHNHMRQVLVQRKPEGWENMHANTMEQKLLRNQVNLIGKKVHVRYQSAHLFRMKNLSDEIGGDIDIIEGPSDVETEELIRMVAEGTIDYTIAEEDVAQVNANYYDHLDVRTPVSFPQQIAWGVRKTSDSLKIILDDWFSVIKNSPIYVAIYNRYFESRRSLLNPSNQFVAIEGGQLSPYDPLIKAAASELSWDWRLLAAQIYHESRFNPLAESWAGAKGLMQLMPMTLKSHGIQNPFDPQQNILAGKRHIRWLNNIWKEEVADPNERVKFILASYNVGQGHVQDAVNLAEKNGYSGEDWSVVEQYLLKKSNSKYYTDPVVKYGYCRGTETVRYVSNVMSLYENYKKLLPKTSQDQTWVKAKSLPS